MSVSNVVRREVWCWVATCLSLLSGVVLVNVLMLRHGLHPVLNLWQPAKDSPGALPRPVLSGEPLEVHSPDVTVTSVHTYSDPPINSTSPSSLKVPAPTSSSNLNRFVPSLTVHGATSGAYNVPQGYLNVTVDYKFPAPDAQQFGGTSDPCDVIAGRIKEPLSEFYAPRGQPATSLNGHPRSFFRWPGKISRAEFDAVPSRLRGPACPHCVNVVRFKIYNGQLYREPGTFQEHVQIHSEMVLAALHLFKIPNVDFLMQFGDGCPKGMPIINWNICRDQERAGFTMPSYSAWEFSFGPKQLAVLHQCFATRYPAVAANRQAVVYWRGSTTDVKYTSFNGQNYRDAARIKLHTLMRNQEGFDVKLARLLNTDATVNQQITDLGNTVHFEQNNKNQFILDIDGNGWSDRFNRMMHFNTPILKQASVFTAFFEHLITPGQIVEYYDNSLSDVVPRGQALLKEMATPEGEARLFRMAEQMQGLGAVVLNQVAILEALAWTLQLYASKIDWEVQAPQDGKMIRIPFTACCRAAHNIPPEFVDAVRAREKEFSGGHRHHRKVLQEEELAEGGTAAAAGSSASGGSGGRAGGVEEDLLLDAGTWPVDDHGSSSSSSGSSSSGSGSGAASIQGSSSSGRSGSSRGGSTEQRQAS